MSAVRHEPEAPAPAPAPARLDLRGATIGLLWNGKSNGDNLLRELDARLRTAFGVARIVWGDKASEASGAMWPAPEDLLARFTQVPAVITGPGDCGSCTSGTVHDAVELQKRGIRSIAVCTAPYGKMAALECRALGVPEVPVGLVEHPLIGRDAEYMKRAVDGLMPLLAEHFVIDPAYKDSAGPANVVVPDDDGESEPDPRLATYRHWHELSPAGLLDELYEASLGPDIIYDILDTLGLGDGLPVGSVDPQYLREWVGVLGLDAGDLIATVPPLHGELTSRRLAACAALAGVPASHARVLAAIASGLNAPQLNAYATLSTTGATAFLSVINGPVRSQLRFNSGANCLGPGNRSNATVGRALSLFTRIVGGAREGAADAATQGTPSKYTFCFAENEEKSPWEPLHVERGLTAETSAVTIMCISGTIEAYENYGAEPERHIDALAPALANCHAQITPVGEAARGRGLLGGGEPVVVMSPEWAVNFADAGWSKRDVKRALFERAVSAADPSRHVARNADDILIVVAGGHGYKQTIAPNWIGGPRAATIVV